MFNSDRNAWKGVKNLTEDPGNWFFRVTKTLHCTTNFGAKIIRNGGIWILENIYTPELFCISVKDDFEQ